MKTQTIRLFDVFVLGPAMIVAGSKLVARSHPVLGTFVSLAGLGTSVYNWRNYRDVEGKRST